MNTITRWRPAAAALLLMLAAGLAGPSLLTAAEPASPVAVVNGQPISSEAFERESDAYMRRLVNTGQNPALINMKRARQQILENMVSEELLWQACQRLDMVATSEETGARMAKFKERYPDDAKLKAALGSAGLTEADLERLIKRQTSIRKLIDKHISKNIDIADKDVRAYFDDHKDMFDLPERVEASHILIKSGADASDEHDKAARRRAEEIRQKALKGEDFAALAREYSEGPSSKNGGRLPVFTRERMVPAFSRAAFATKPGEISELVKTQYGYHVIRVTDHMAAGIAPFEDVAEGIRKQLQQERLKADVDAYVRQLRETADITLNSPAS